MGSVAGAFLPDDGPWLPADTTDPLYRRDYENMLHSLEHHDMASRSIRDGPALAGRR